MGKLARINAKNRANGTSSPSLYKYSQEVRDWVGVLTRDGDKWRTVTPRPTPNDGRTCWLGVLDGGRISFAELGKLTGLDPDQVAFAIHFYQDKHDGNEMFSGYLAYRARVDAALAK